MMGELIRQEAVKLASQRFPYLLAAAVVALQAVATLAAVRTPPDERSMSSMRRRSSPKGPRPACAARCTCCWCWGR